MLAHDFLPLCITSPDSDYRLDPAGVDANPCMSAMTGTFDALSCPLDGGVLQREGARWCCPSGHSFDVAAQGYTHLLPVQHKRSRDPGDSKEMIAARRRFLQTGHYAAIADAVCARVLAQPHPGRALDVLDAGCGEGYYLRALQTAAWQTADTLRTGIADRGADTGQTGQQTGEAHAGLMPLRLVGVDISKWAVMAAARRNVRATWLVATNANLPIRMASLDVVLCMFGFPVYPEFARVLRPGGLLLQVDAGPDHLRELRSVIYPSLRAERPVVTQMPTGFRRQTAQRVRAKVTLSSAQEIGDLLIMTPHFYRAGGEGRARAAALTHLTTTLDVEVTPFICDSLETDDERL